MAVIGCIPGAICDLIQKAILDGKIDPDVLMNSSSVERSKLLSEIVGESNIDQVHGLNSLIESKLLLKNQKQGIINAIKKMTNLSEKDRSDLIALKVDRINEYMNPENMDKFLADLAQDKVNRQYKLDISAEEAKTIVEYTRSIEQAKNSIPEDSPIRSKERLDYGLQKAVFNDYVGNLKKAPFKISDLVNPTKILDTLGGTLKSTVASLDNSFFGRQGIKALYTNPDIWTKDFLKSWVDIGKQIISKSDAKGIGKLFDGGNDAATLAIKADVYSRPNAINGKYEAGGYGIQTKAEEAYPSSLPERIPVFGRLFKASETAYNGGALRMRADLADRTIANAEKFGVDTLAKDEANYLGSLVSSMTGRGNIGKAEAIGKELNALAFSIKFLKSNIDTLIDPLRYVTKKVGIGGGFENKGEEYALRSAAGNLLKIIGTVAAILTTAEFLHPGSTSIDPNSSLFGKIKIGNTTFDVTGGMGSLVTLAARLTPQKRSDGWGFYSTSSITGKVTKLNSGKYGAPTALDLIDNFWQGKLSPLAGMARDMWKGTDFNGNPSTPVNLIKNSVTPLVEQNYQDLTKDPNSADTLASMILDGLGISMSNYGGTQSDLAKTLPNTPPELIKEFDRLQATGNKPSTSSLLDGAKVKEMKNQLSPDEYLKYTQELQSEYKKQITQEIGSSNYKMMTDVAEKNKLDSIKDGVINKISGQHHYKKPEAPSKLR